MHEEGIKKIAAPAVHSHCICRIRIKIKYLHGMYEENLWEALFKVSNRLLISLVLDLRNATLWSLLLIELDVLACSSISTP
jgi:hypothetical protein